MIPGGLLLLVMIGGILGDVEPDTEPVASDQPTSQPSEDEESATEVESDEPEPEPEPEPTEEQVSEGQQAYDNATVAQQNAADSALSYLDYSAFSRSGLIEQLEYEGYSTSDAEFGVNLVETYIGIDWNEQAAKSAEDYMDYSSFSRSGLIEQLEFEGFTREQAEHGVDSVGL